MQYRTIYPVLCKESSCLAEAAYEFTDAEAKVKVTDENGSSATSIETVIIGHACEDHFDKVQQMLKEIYDGDKESNNV